MLRKNDDVWHPPVAGKCGWGGIETQIVFGHLKIFYSVVQKTRF
jgi:hypothetical protein